jgi:UDP:flavonoid glycosyltransferase YjiC (YdhE family)
LKTVKKIFSFQAKEVIHWLDTQPIASVIYIAFGSMVRLPLSALEILAKALSPYSFIWSLKTEMTLPSLLMNLDSHRQLILEWTPQRAILEHPSISFFFSHGGWNSLLEGMIHGKAILVWPFFADQFDNAEQLVDLGMARQVSNHLEIDIESMLTNDSYTNKAKQIQQLVLQARESSSKEQIADIIQFISSKEKLHDEF